MKAKPVQIAIIVIGLLVGIVGIVLAMSKNSGPDLADKMIMVDVTSGQTYAVSVKGRSIVIPYRSPESQERTLLPVNQREDKSWYLEERYMGSLEKIKNISDLVDPKTGKVELEAKIKPTTLK